MIQKSHVHETTDKFLRGVRHSSLFKQQKPELSSGFTWSRRLLFIYPTLRGKPVTGPSFPRTRVKGRAQSLEEAPCGVWDRAPRHYIILYNKKRKQEKSRFLSPDSYRSLPGTFNLGEKNLCAENLFSAICPAGTRTPDRPGRIALPLSYRTFFII